MIRKNYLKQVFLSGIVILYVCLGATVALGQQTISRTITVKEGRNNAPLPGATVVNLTTKLSTATNETGTANLEASPGDKLRVTLLGYVAQTAVVGSENSVEVVLVPEEQNIGEVVVTALGIKRETRGLTYATQQISAEAVNDARDNSGNIMSSLSGKVAGAVVTTASSGPGAAARVVLRGNKSISGNNNALVVVDGVPYDNTPGTQATGTTPNYGTGDGAANINPDDIESINILKGPSAAALYGTRAANGAIIITTKQGREGRYNIEYNGSAAIDQVNMLASFQNTYGRGNGGVAGTNIGESWGERGTTYSNNVRNFFQNSSTFNNSISTYGGTEKVQGYMSYSNNKIGGIFQGNDLKRNSLNVRLNTEFIPGLKTDVKLNYVNQQVDNRPRLGDMGIPIEAYIMPRDMDDGELKDFETIDPADGKPLRKYWSGSTLYDNPYWSLNRTSVNEVRDRITALGSVSYQLTDWLNVLGRYSFDKYKDVVDGSFYHSTVSLGDVRYGGKYYETHTEYSEQNFDFLLNGEHKLSDNIQLNYNVGTSFLKRTYDTFQNMANGLTIPNHFSFRMATTPEFLNVRRYERQLNSVYGSAQLGFYNNIFLDLTARNDWSSTLPTPHSFFYPSAGLSVVFNEWLNMPSWVTFGKARASYTQVGNDADPYLLDQLYQFGLGAGRGFVSRSATKAIPDLKPELTKSFEVGLDMRFFNDRLTFDATYYKSNTINQLIFLGLPMASGFSREYINAGKIENKGFEIQLTGAPIRNDVFSWNTNVNFATNTNTILELHEKTKRANVTENTKYATVVVNEGEKYGDLYGHVWKKDANGQYIVNANGLPVVEANQKLGNFNPKALLGWSNTFTYGNISLHTLLDARIGGEIVSGTAAYLAAFGVADFTETHREGNWVIPAVYEDGTTNSTAITSQQFWTTVSQSGRDAWGEFFTYDMTNVRFRELAISYKFNVESWKGIQSAQVSLTGRNLFFLYRGKSKLDIPGLGKIKNPVDPEGALGAGNYQGVEVGLPPTVRTYGLNVKVTF
ncbi:SusC/RagA family TonB-linked outer membrane protein [Sphingobacterium chuzhouense]|uniref:SusC/RagA family TonB-linked outer membrane protein n=1 Tax=Sphingobacterium chuzhouense TaxID=1742264 RepID=A0ABR7XMN7_9SPHI|nr:SusC/RagA family TonB-linked outer membrane protein [Sphingobacterium chuzhouense]MBD1420429.1 SusC/RagA family TonB-linked outer membrane protein [Sphingobacterium chuzhouense]